MHATPAPTAPAAPAGTAQPTQSNDTFRRIVQTQAGILFVSGDTVCVSDGKGGAKGIRYTDGTELPKLSQFPDGCPFLVGDHTLCQPMPAPTPTRSDDTGAQQPSLPSPVTVAVHTAGPWRYEESTKTIRAVPSNYWLATMDSWDGAVNNEANARLIAAAPDLLAALERIAAVLNQPVQFTGTTESGACAILRGDAKLARETALKAIAKATQP